MTVDLVKELRKAADEMRQEDQLGWPVLCDATAEYIEALKAVLAKAKAFHDRDAGCNGFTADYEILRLEIDEALR